MPAYPLAFPTNVDPANVRVRRRTATSVHESPFTFQAQAYVHPGVAWAIEVTLQPMPEDLAAAWTQFFYDLHGRAGTFTLDLDPYCPGLVPAPGEVTFRLVDPDVGWDAKPISREYGFEFRATEDV